VGVGFFIAGAVYWLIWARLLPKLGGYELTYKKIIDSEGWPRRVVYKAYHDGRHVEEASTTAES
jgi:hypothetical protein